jgi:hypothetical protein
MNLFARLLLEMSILCLLFPSYLLQISRRVTLRSDGILDIILGVRIGSDDNFFPIE